MAKMMHTRETIEREKVVAILRGVEEAHLVGALQALQHGGVRCVEISMNAPHAAALLRKASKQFEGHLLLGAGSVVDEAGAKEAIGASAHYVLSPTLDTDMVQICNEYSVLPIPGVWTPNELMRASRCGADLIKLFPAAMGGPDYVSSLLGPMEWLKLIVVGGITLENAPAFLKAGAVAVGACNAICSAELANSGNYEEIAKRAEAFVQAVRG